jgi:hypothetical protein
MTDESLRELGLPLGATEGDFVSAAERLVLRYESAAQSGSSSAAYRGAGVPSLDVTLALLFRLHELARVTEARRLEDAVAAWIRTNPHEEPGGPGAIAWRRARDLGALPDALSPAVRRALAHASQIGDLASAARPLRTFGRVDRRLLADADLLRQSGGAFAALADELEPPDALPAASRALAGGRNTVVVGGALLTFLVALAFTGRSSRTAARPSLVPSYGGGGPNEDALDAVARLRGSLGLGLQDQEARAIARALSEHDCRTALDRLDALTAGGPYPKTQSLVDAVANGVHHVCGAAQAK